MGGPSRFHPLVDWTMLLPLLRRRASLTRIGDTAGIDEATINRLARGAIKDRRFSQGLCLVDCAPAGRAPVARRPPHPVLPRPHGVATDLPNLALVCVAHPVALPQGGWTLALRPGVTGHERDCWEFTPPPLRARRLRP